tara:strand:+ start:47 stop:841 length:795 start_codon:yes stop_codon:yes gene_type:complete
MSHPALSIILPVFRCCEKAQAYGHALAEHCHNESIDAEIIFVDDGNTDDTAQTLSALNLAVASRVISLSKNQGKGLAVAVGLLSARGNHCIFSDADGAYEPKSVIKLYRALQEGHDVAIANRRLQPSATTSQSNETSTYLMQRQLTGNFFATVTQFLLGIHFTDTQAGLKGFARDAAAHIFQRIRHHGFLFDLEVMIICQQAGLNVKEVPIQPHVTDDHSTVNMLKLAFSFLPDVFKIRGAAKKGTYQEVNAQVVDTLNSVTSS